ncbi:hypothetical protein BS333_02955 [Vibrio azureus]|uniref:DUF218 domain-containing protein n=1 Tax=Vibrio azureus NBRC 104587 TaxID=1219077 RepID=U3C1Y3_9VIBR|nr:YdcF family protein [Vibrio azureus]AUI85423.1 hypothetical protein BS333_02955 [Vibrio azureus]GAD75489.1 hypothetical protein VAZ01S_025_00850 [Vibrio azureus NBRC 104587]
MFFRFFLGCLVSVSLLVSALYLDAKEPQPFIAEVGVIYGNKVELNGKPSARLVSRLDAALTLYHDQKVKRLFVSGGIGKEGFDEALVMKNYLLSHDVKPEHIMTDNQGNNTHLTSQNLLEQFDITTPVVAISQRYHISRAKLSLKQSGFLTVYGYSADYWEPRDIYSYLREIPAWLKYKIYHL